MHAVLVQDGEAVSAIQSWHSEQQPGPLVLLPVQPGPVCSVDEVPLADRLNAEGPAAGGVRAALAGSQVLDESGRVLRRASGAIFLAGVGAPLGPIRRRAELATLTEDIRKAEHSMSAAEEALRSIVEQLGVLEQALGEAAAAAERARESERQAIATREDVGRMVGNLSRETAEADTQMDRLTERLLQSERRLGEIDQALVADELARGRVEEALSAARVLLAELEAEQEDTREQRAHWQVQEAHLAGS